MDGFVGMSIRLMRLMVDLDSFVHVAKHDKSNSNIDKMKNFTVLLMETGRTLLKPPNEVSTLVFDLTGFSLNNMDYTFVKFLITCLEAYYPESLSTILVLNAPWIFNGTLLLIGLRSVDPRRMLGLNQALVGSESR